MELDTVPISRLLRLTKGKARVSFRESASLKTKSKTASSLAHARHLACFNRSRYPMCAIHFGTGQIGIERASRSIGSELDVYAQHDLRDLAPIGAILPHRAHAHMGDGVLLIVFGHCRPLGAISLIFVSIRGGIEPPHWMKRGLDVWRAEARVAVESTSVPTIVGGGMRFDVEQRMTPMRPDRDRPPAHPDDSRRNFKEWQARMLGPARAPPGPPFVRNAGKFPNCDVICGSHPNQSA